MAAQAWQFYNMAREFLLDNTIDIDGATFRMSLYSSAAGFATATFSTRDELSGAGFEVTEQFGYSSSGKTVSASTWITGASAGVRRFDSTAVVWTATGGIIEDIKAAVIWISAAGGQTGSEKLMLFASLTSTEFTLASGNTLTITPSATGIFELNSP